MDDSAEKFPNRARALAYLQRQGYKLAKSKFYADCQAGLVILEMDGSILMTSIERYIALTGLRKPAEDTVKSAALADQKHRELIRNLKLKNKKLEHDFAIQQRKFVLKSEAESQLVRTLLAFFAYLRSRFLTDAGELISKTGGDSSRAGLMKKLLENLLNDALHEGFAEGEIIAEIGEDEEGVFDRVGGDR